MCRSHATFEQSMATPAPSGSGGKGSIRPGIATSSLRQLVGNLALLFDVIRSGRWPSFEKVALSNPRVFRMICNCIPNIEEFKRHTTLLHAVLRHDPPFEIVAKILPMLPDPVSALRFKDCRGRTPLHVAAACDAHPRIIKLLGSMDPKACTTLDENSRTPLHLACDTSRAPTEDEADQRQRKAPSLETLRALLSYSLVASMVEDDDGMNALECAIVSDASFDVVTLLQKVTVESNKRRESSRSRKRQMADDARGEGNSRRIRRRSVSLGRL